MGKILISFPSIGSIKFDSMISMLNVVEAAAPVGSVAVTRIFNTSSPVGVPEKVVEIGSKTSHAGKGFPFKSAAWYVSVLFPSSSIKVESGIV